MKKLGIVSSAIVLSSLVLSGTANASQCEDKELVKSGTIRGNVKSVGLLLGYRWAEGVITLNNGTSYRIRAKGGKIAEVGYTDTEVVGTIYNLKDIRDFAGTYSGVSAGVTLFKGLGGASFTNTKCVSINVKKSDATGLQTSLPAPGIVNIEFVDFK